MKKLLAVMLLGLIGVGCERSHLSACGWECNEIDWFTLRSEGSLSPDRLELVWHLAAKPRHWSELWRPKRWPKLTVSLSLPAAVLDGEEVGSSACMGIAGLEAPGLESVEPLVVFVDSLRLTRSGNSVVVEATLNLERNPSGTPPPPVHPLLRIELALSDTAFELADTLSPKGAELVGDWATECAGRQRKQIDQP